MYLHLGQSVVVPAQDIIGIFDLDTASCSKRTRAFLERAERGGELADLSMDLPKSFLVCQSELGTVVYLSQLNSATLRGRAETNHFEAQVSD